MHVVVVGAGVIGSSLAFDLSLRGAAVTVVERCGVACAASGRAGGFLAQDWCDGTALEPLARRSFALHAELADRLGGGTSWGYRRVTTHAGSAGRRAGGGERALGWLAVEVSIGGRIGSTDTTAQVDPALFTQAMMGAARANGAVLRGGTVDGLIRRGDAVRGVRVDGAPLEADAVVIAAGPWSVVASRWLALPPVGALKGHSAVFETGGALGADALFLDVADAGGVLTPEVFPRADGSTYVCAISSEAALPVDPGAVGPDRGAIERLLALCARLSPALERAAVRTTGACFRPITADGLPLIGPVPEAPGAFVATGHGVWGILNAPATAEALGAVILGGDDRSLASFDPGRRRARGGR